jgi:hypothetical protein
MHFIIVYFLNFSSVYREILRGRGLFHATGHAITYVTLFEKVTCPLLFKVSQRYIANIIGVACNSQIPPAICSKGYLIPFAMALKDISDPLASCRKEFDYRMQCSFIFTDFLDFACGS